MTALFTIPAVQTLAWTLAHFLWQGAAIGVLFFLWLRLRRPAAQARYGAGILALTALLAAPAATFSWLAITVPGEPVVVAAPAAGTVPRAVYAGTAPVVPILPADSRAPAAPDPGATARQVAAVTIVTLWAAGVLLLSLRLAGGWIVARRIAARAAQPAADEVLALAAALSERLGVTRAVRLVESTAVSVPMLVGWMKPVVLLPAAALSGLSTGQIEALIAHELAHVRRHDYAVNILQSIVETLLFYHPAVWLVSREVREAREHCCDDLAVGVCDRTIYVTALADLAAMGATPRVALAATGGSLLARVQRILGQPRDSSPGVAWLGALSLALVLGGVMPGALASPESDPAGATQGPGGEVAGGQAEGVSAGPEGVSGGGVRGEAAIAPVEDRAGRSSDRDQSERQRLDETARQMRQAEAEFRELFQRLDAVKRQVDRGPMSPVEVRELEARIASLERLVAATRAGQETPAGRTQREVSGSSTAQLEARAAMARAEFDAARGEYGASRRLYDGGLLSSDALMRPRERLAAAERELAAATVEVQATAEEAALRDTIDVRRARLQGESRVAEAEAELMIARKTYESVRQRFDVGLARSDDVADVQARMEAAERRLGAARAELQLTQEEIAMRQTQTTALRRLVVEMENLNARYALGPGEGAERLLDAPVVKDAAAQAKAGDILSIEIPGEPDLPRAYPVDADGAIRLPLVGSIAVAGLTVQQIRDAVALQLQERRLAEGKTVVVTLRRPQ